jgi:hypothetical protein
MGALFGIRPAPYTPNEIQICEGAQLPMKTKIGWLALFAVLAYAVVQAVQPTLFNHAVSLIASAVWGS